MPADATPGTAQAPKVAEAPVPAGDPDPAMAAIARADGTVDGAGAEAPDAERVISDVETLKAISDPLRLRILETMVARREALWTAKELAVALDVPQTRLYHHIELLLERDLIRLASQRVVSGIIESRYRVAALSFRLDSSLLSGGSPAADEASRDLMQGIFDSAREEVIEAIRAYLAAHPGADLTGDAPGDPERPVLSRGMAMLPPARAGEFKARLFELMREYDAVAGDPDAVPFGFLISLYRVPEPKEPSDD